MSSNSTQTSPETDSPSSDDILTYIRPFVSYSQSQILCLYKSPLVSPPNGMPPLKDWFGYASSLLYVNLQTMYTLETGTNKAFRKRILKPPLPPLERGTNGGFILNVVSIPIFSPFILASGVIKKMLVQSSSSSSLTRSLTTPPSQSTPPRAQPSAQRCHNLRKWGTSSTSLFAQASVTGIKMRTEIVNVTFGIKKAKNDFAT